MTFTEASKPVLGRGFRLQWEQVQNTHVLLYPEGMVKLNGSAGEIMVLARIPVTVIAKINAIGGRGVGSTGAIEPEEPPGITRTSPNECCRSAPRARAGH